jgi:hypothetical protein
LLHDHARVLSRLRSALVTLVCVVTGAYFLTQLNGPYPIRDWLFWPLLEIVAWCALFHIACLSFGHLVVSRWLRQGNLPTTEKVVASMAVGVVAFVTAMYIGGALALYGPVFAIALPSLMLVAGAGELWIFVQGWRASRFAKPHPPLHPLVAAAIVVGVLCCGLLYLQSMTPDALNYDSKWYHLTVAQDYAREGRIVPFPGDYNKNMPQLVGLVHAWGWMVPGPAEPVRWMMVLHQELAIVLWTLAAVSAGVSWFAERARVPGAWTVFFLFPGIFVYDSNIGGSADHFLGFFAVPLFLAAIRAGEGLAPRRCALLGIIAAATVLTKYQSIYMLGAVGALFVGMWLRKFAAEVWPRWGGMGATTQARTGSRAWLWKGPVVAAMVGLLLTLPHFLKNWIFYRNPVYPYLTTVFTGSHPSLPETPLLVANLLADNNAQPQGTFWHKLSGAFWLLFTFSLKPHYSITRPVIGSLFTLLLPVIPLLRRSRRLMLGVFVSLVALMGWGFTYLVDRNLQTFLPLLIAVTGGVILRAWDAGWLARPGLIALVLAQLVWSGDAFFFSGEGHLSDAVSMIRSGYDGKAKTRFDKYLRGQVGLQKRLPPEAVVLFHNTRLSLGVNRPVVQDLPGFQGLISYSKVRTPRELCELYRSLGITHIVHERGSWKAFTRQEEVVFDSFLARFAQNRTQENEYELIELPADLPPAEAPYRVLGLGLTGYHDGIYPVDAMGTVEPLLDRLKTYAEPEVPTTGDATAAPEIIDHVNAVLIGSGTTPPAALATELSNKFINIFSFGGDLGVYVRSTSTQPPVTK